MPIIHDFHTDLEYSVNLCDDERLDNFYKQAFPLAVKVEFCSDLSEQLKGIDKIIYFQNGNSITVDEKKRRKDYGDILLELWKNKKHRKPGWLFYSQCDYIVYAVLEANKIYLLPTVLLQMAWKANREQWLSRYMKKEALNDGYITVNIAIPTEILLNAVLKEMTKKL